MRAPAGQVLIKTGIGPGGGSFSHSDVLHLLEENIAEYSEPATIFDEEREQARRADTSAGSRDATPIYL